MTPGGEPLYVYVDESGDRGWGPKSTPVFLLAAVIVRQSEEPALTQMLEDVNRALGRQPHTVLHWAENVRRHDQRKFVASQLAKLPATYLSVILHKESLRGNAPGLTDHNVLYRYMIRRLYERVSWYARSHRGKAMVRLAHVRRFKYQDLHRYLDILRSDPNCSIEWNWFSGRYPRVDQPATLRALQVADLLAGCVYAAFDRDNFGAYEPAYLQVIAPRLWTGPTRKLHTYGLHLVGTHGCWEAYDWWTEISAAAGRDTR